MDSLEPRGDLARAAAAALTLAAALLFVLLQEVGLALRREEQRAWWPGTGRDLLNAAGFACIAGALRVYGFPLPAALLAGGTLTLALFGASIFLETRPWRGRRALALAAGALAAAPVVLFPAAILRALGQVTARLFGG